MTDYEKLKQVIQTANPEIMAWEFGCEGLDKQGRKWIACIDGWYLPNGKGYMTFEPYKILGRPIRLADVLLALWEKRIKPLEGWLFVDIQGQFISGIDLEEKGIFWNLKEDDLSKQSPETIKFLTELLCG